MWHHVRSCDIMWCDTGTTCGIETAHGAKWTWHPIWHHTTLYYIWFFISVISSHGCRIALQLSCWRISPSSIAKETPDWIMPWSKTFKKAGTFLMRKQKWVSGSFKGWGNTTYQWVAEEGRPQPSRMSYILGNDSLNHSTLFSPQGSIPDRRIKLLLRMLKLQDLYTYQTIDSGPRVRTSVWV